VTVSTILVGAGCLVASAGIWKAVRHVVTTPPRYARPVRMDFDGPPRPPHEGADLGISLICAGAALLLAAAYRLV
jgi:hypothetical protein